MTTPTNPEQIAPTPWHTGEDGAAIFGANAHRSIDTALADRALREGWRRHTPVASNHYPDARHGTRQWHRYPDRDDEELESVAVLYPPESDDDPTAGLWWVLVPHYAADSDPR